MADSEVKYGDLGHTIAEESFPDLLKNTPSNIARLEDVIEHSKGRQKYLAQTRSPSDGGDVRWYFSKVPLLETVEVSKSCLELFPIWKEDCVRFMRGRFIQGASRSGLESVVVKKCIDCVRFDCNLWVTLRARVTHIFKIWFQVGGGENIH